MRLGRFRHKVAVLADCRNALVGNALHSYFSPVLHKVMEKHPSTCRTNIVLAQQAAHSQDEWDSSVVPRLLPAHLKRWGLVSQVWILGLRKYWSLVIVSVGLQIGHCESSVWLKYLFLLPLNATLWFHWLLNAASAGASPKIWTGDTRPLLVWACFRCNLWTIHGTYCILINFSSDIGLKTHQHDLSTATIAIYHILFTPYLNPFIFAYLHAAPPPVQEPISQMHYASKLKSDEFKMKLSVIQIKGFSS